MLTLRSKRPRLRSLSSSPTNGAAPNEYDSHRKHYFTDFDDVLITCLLPTGEYGCYSDETTDGRIRGFGHTRLAAIADYKEWLEDQKDDGE